MEITKTQIKASSRIVSLLRPPEENDNSFVIHRSLHGVVVSENDKKKQRDHTMMYKHQGFMDSSLQQSCLDYTEIEDLDKVYDRIKKKLNPKLQTKQKSSQQQDDIPREKRISRRQNMKVKSEENQFEVSDPKEQAGEGLLSYAKLGKIQEQYYKLQKEVQNQKILRKHQNQQKYQDVKLQDTEQKTLDLLGLHYTGNKRQLNLKVNEQLHTYRSTRVGQKPGSKCKEYTQYMQQTGMVVKNQKNIGDKIYSQTQYNSPRIQQSETKFQDSSPPAQTQRNYIISMVTGQPQQPYIQLDRLKQQDERFIKKTENCFNEEQMKATYNELQKLGFFARKGKDGTKPGVPPKSTSVRPFRRSGNYGRASLNSSVVENAKLCNTSMNEIQKAQKFEKISGKAIKSEIRLIEAWKQFQNTKSLKKKQFNEMLITIDKDRPLTSDIRRKAYIPAIQIAPANTKLNKLRAISEEERKKRFDQFQGELTWYKELLQYMEKITQMDQDITVCQKLMDSLRSSLEQCQLYQEAEFFEVLDEIISCEEFVITKATQLLINKIADHFNFDKDRISHFNQLIGNLSQQNSRRASIHKRR